MAVKSDYAWRIDHDHLSDPGEIGTTGPRSAALDRAGVPAGYQHTASFQMFDDDQILYVTGTLFWNGAADPAEHQAYGPLGDYGMPGLGAVRIHYPANPSWDCG